VSALARAIDDFTADDIPDDSKNRVVVFTGTGTDECYGTNAPAEINREIERTGIDAEFRLVGLHVEKADQQQLQSISDALGKNAEVLFAPTKAELDAAVDELPDGGDGGTTTTTGTSDGASDESQVLPAD
jgi:hypothetical protein